MADIDVVVKRTIASATFSDMPPVWFRSAGPEVAHPKADTVTIIVGNTGQVAFYASPDHFNGSVVTGYYARIRVYGSSTVVVSGPDGVSLGKPTPDGNGVIVVDLSSSFAGLAAGNYTVSIMTRGPGGDADSAESAPFSLPLS